MSDIQIATIEVPERGCGFRKKGGFYMCHNGASIVTNFFPKPLTCGCGLQIIRPSRSTQSFLPGMIWKALQEEGPGNPFVHFAADTPAWAMTIDVKNYPTPSEYLGEAAKMGISRRLNNGMPKGFVIGEHWVFLIHGKAIRQGVEGPGAKSEWAPGFIAAFKPEIQYVVAGNESKDYLMSLQKKGITLVNVPNAV